MQNLEKPSLLDDLNVPSKRISLEQLLLDEVYLFIYFTISLLLLLLLSFWIADACLNTLFYAVHFCFCCPFPYKEPWESFLKALYERYTFIIIIKRAVYRGDVYNK